MKDKRLPISVLIPTMNRPKALKRTLEYYFNGNFIPSQIVIVDHSEDYEDRKRIRQIVENYISYAEITYIYQNIPSLTKARNTAFRYATQEVIIFSDDDIDVYNDTVGNVYEIMKDDSIAMIAGTDDNTRQSVSNIGYLLGTKSFYNRKIGHVTLSMLGRFPINIKEKTNTMWAMGFFFVIRKSLMDKWKIEWDEKLIGYAYAEDLDFSYSYYKKAREEDLRCIMSCQVHVKHIASSEYRTQSRKSTFMYVLNRAYLSYKHEMGRKSEIAMNWCNFWLYIGKVVHHENTQDMKEAIIYLKTHKSEIRNGEFHY